MDARHSDSRRLPRVNLFPGILLGTGLLLSVGPAVWAASETETSSDRPPTGITGGMASAAQEDETSAPPASEAPQEAPPAAAPVAALPRPTATQQERLQTIVNLSFTNASLKNVLNSLAKIYGLNLVAGEAVEGTVTLTLRGVTLEEGLRQMLKLNGFGFAVKGEIIEVNRLEEKRVNQLVYLKYLTTDTALEFIKSLASEGAILKADESSNAILVSDFQPKIDDMRSALEEIDKPPQQVLIESKLMDITHTDLDNLGLNWSAVAINLPTRSGHLPLLLTGGTFNLKGPSSTLTSTESTFTLARGITTFTVAINALIRDNKVKVIASPTILTLNTVEAKITIGEKFPIREQTQTSTGTLETTRFVDVGTTLRVTPRINRDGYIQMHLHPEVSSVSSTLDAGPRITTREADTTVLVKDGQPIVIAGLIQQDESTINGGIPVLKHIPFFGLLFQNHSRDHTRKELVIVITPHLINVGTKADDARVGEPKAPVQEAGTRLGVYDLFQQGIAMQQQLSLQAQHTPDILRYMQAIDSFQRVVDTYPTHPYAPEALWRIGAIARDDLHDLDRAQAAYDQLIKQYPDSRYRKRAEERLAWLQHQRSPWASFARRTRPRAPSAPGRFD